MKKHKTGYGYADREMPQNIDKFHTLREEEFKTKRPAKKRTKKQAEEKPERMAS